MHIYIDESGSFDIPKGRPKPSISCAGALIVPERDHDKIAAGFVKLSQPWPKEKGEVKGRLLGEAQVDCAIGYFADQGILFDCVAIDLGLHRVAEANAHKETQARRIMKHITPEYHPNVIREAKRHQASLRAISAPDYVHITVLTQLVQTVLDTKVMYYAQHAPAEIGAFWWTIDAKDKIRTRSERLWAALVLPFLQSQSIRQPFIQLKEGNYSAFSRFNIKEGKPPEYLRPFVRDWTEGQIWLSSDIRQIMNEHRSFANSAQSIGLQMADVVTSAAARALKGNLREPGWRRLGTLMLKQLRPSEIIRMVQLHSADRHWNAEPPYHRVLRHLRRTAQPLLLTPMRTSPASR